MKLVLVKGRHGEVWLVILHLHQDLAAMCDFPVLVANKINLKEILFAFFIAADLD